VLRAKFQGKPEHVINYLFMVAEEVRRGLAQLGLKSFDALVGRVDLLETRIPSDHPKARSLDLSPILAPASTMRPGVEMRQTCLQDHGLSGALDHSLVEQARPAIETRAPVRIETRVRNVNRTVGALLSHEIVRRHGPDGLPDGTVHIRLTGSAGQSFGAFLAAGVTLELEGDANDSTGKGLSGGRLIVYPPKTATFAGSESVIVGNVGLYGAVSGTAFFAGLAAERFAVRNSGARAVVEGVGDHGCEYMTGGVVVILGRTGRNFAAGMSGGIAYVYDAEGHFARRCNHEMVELEEVSMADDAAELRALVLEHAALTGSFAAQRLLVDWPMTLHRFVKVMPVEYRKALAARAPAVAGRRARLSLVRASGG
jgi:glutamate synthase domain-containing protein 3